MIRGKLEEQREKEVMDEIVKNNNVEVPDDITIPEVTDEQIQQMMQKQQGGPQLQMPPGGPGAPPAPNGQAPKKPAAPPAPPKKK
jgi:hypothetical protein